MPKPKSKFPPLPAPSEIRFREIQEIRPIYDLEAALKAALDKNPRQRRKHKSIRGAAARSIRTRGRDIYTSDVPMSRLDNCMVSAEGLLESDTWIVIDYDFDDLTRMIAQPFPLDIVVFGERHTWTPDALLFRGGRPFMVEVKPLAEVHPENPEHAALAKARFDAMRRAARQWGTEFLLFTENEIRLEPRFYNAQMMFRALNAHIPAQLIFQAIDGLVQLPRDITVNDLSPYLGKFADSTQLVACVLDRRGHLLLDRSRPFSGNAPVVNFLGVCE